MKRLFQRTAATLLAVVLVLPSTLSFSSAEAADTSDVTVLVDENFENDNFDSDIGGRGATIKATSQSNGNHELTISERSADWTGMQIPVNSAAGTTVSVAMKVRSANTQCVLGIQFIQDGNPDTQYKWIQNLDTKEAEYVQFQGTYNVPADAKEVTLFLQGNGTVNKENIMVDEIKVTIPKASTSTDTVKVVEDFEGTSNTAIARSANIEVAAGAGAEGSKGLNVTGRTQNWQGVNFDANTYAGQTIEVSAQVKSKSSEMYLSLQYDTAEGTQYKRVATGKTGSDDFVTLSGPYDIPAGVSNVYLYLEGNDTSDFTVDNFTIAKKAEPKPELKIQEDLVPLKDHLAKVNTIEGKAGVAIPASAIEDEARMQMVTKHFNSITCENEMKPESILGSEPTLDENGNLVLNFKQADKIMDFILDYNTIHPNNTIGVRGHVLLWHSQTPSWFFKENYAADGAYVTKEEMLKRMEYYFRSVIQHYDGAGSKYKGIIYAWDVVNEQIDNGGLRKSDGGSGISNWYQVFKGDNIYIKEAFRLANMYAPKTVKLYYNDYGETDSVKADTICKLIEEIKMYPGARVDGMGMQGHYDMQSPAIDNFEKAVRTYSTVVHEISLTELDLQSSSDYDGTNQEIEYTKQAYRYKELFDKLYELDQVKGIDIIGVTMWGTHDGASWLNSASHVGGGADGSRKQCPLLFDNAYQAKPAYYGIVDPGKLEPFTKNIVALYSAKENWTAIPKSTYSDKNTQVTFQTLWTKDNLKVHVSVQDNTVSEDDKIIVYVDEANSKKEASEVELKAYTLERSKANAVDKGYEGTITIPLSDSKVGKRVGLDVAVMNNGVKLSWNDSKNTQETTSKYYGEVMLKPYAEFNFGTPKVDGKLDSIWKSQSILPLTVKTGSPVASAEVRVMWDEEYLYVFAEITDSIISKASANAWEQDSLEIFVDQNNGKTTSYQEDDCQYRINYENTLSFNGNKCNADHISSVAKQTDKGYVIEAAIKWTDIKPENGTLIGVDFQINDDAGAGSRAGTYNWYDEKGSGYANPSVFGTAALVK